MDAARRLLAFPARIWFSIRLNVTICNNCPTKSIWSTTEITFSGWSLPKCGSMDPIWKLVLVLPRATCVLVLLLFIGLSSAAQRRTHGHRRTRYFCQRWPSHRPRWIHSLSNQERASRREKPQFIVRRQTEGELSTARSSWQPENQCVGYLERIRRTFVFSNKLSSLFGIQFICCLEIPKLLPVAPPEQAEEPLDAPEEEEQEAPAKTTQTKRNLKTSGPKIVDPYAEDQTSSLLPYAIAIAAVILPVVFCLCRLWKKDIYSFTKIDKTPHWQEIFNEQCHLDITFVFFSLATESPFKNHHIKIPDDHVECLFRLLFWFLHCASIFVSHFFFVTD